jgi:hypothetical protein
MKAVLGSAVLGLVLFVSGAWGSPHARCDLDACFGKQPRALQEKVLAGETMVITSQVSGSPYEMQYAFRRVRGADPALVGGLFASADELKEHVPAITKAERLRRAGATELVAYELDVARLAGAGAGKIASMAPISRYAVVNNYSLDSGKYLVWWEIEAAETTRLNPRKGLFGGMSNLGEPEHVSGYILIEPVAGSPDSIVSYANYVVPKSSMARAMSGQINKTSSFVLRAFVDRLADWAETVATGDTTAQARYRARVCELVATTP